MHDLRFEIPASDIHAAFGTGISTAIVVFMAYLPDEKMLVPDTHVTAYHQIYSYAGQDEYNALLEQDAKEAARTRATLAEVSGTYGVKILFGGEVPEKDYPADDYGWDPTFDALDRVMRDAVDSLIVSLEKIPVELIRTSDLRVVAMVKNVYGS